MNENRPTSHDRVATVLGSDRRLSAIFEGMEPNRFKSIAMEDGANLRGASEFLQAFDHLLQTIYNTLGPLGAWMFLVIFPVIALGAFLYWLNQRDEGWKEALRGKEKDIQRLADDNRTLRVQALIHGGMAPDLAERIVMKNIPPDGASSRRQLENDLE